MRFRIAIFCLVSIGIVGAWRFMQRPAAPPRIAAQIDSNEAYEDEEEAEREGREGLAVMIGDGHGLKPVPPPTTPPGPGMLTTPEQIARQDAINNDPNSITVGTPWIGDVGVTETIEQIMAREAAEQAARGNAPPPVIMKPELEARHRRRMPSAPGAPVTSQWPPADAIQGEAHADPTGWLRPHHGGSPLLPQTISTSFQAIQTSESNAFPPDTEGDVSPTQIFVALNNRFKSFGKAGGAGSLNTGSNSFFTSVGGGSGTSDPRVIFDRTAQRWFVIILNLAGPPNRCMIAVSNGATFTNSTSFTFFFFVPDTVTPSRGVSSFMDYPSLGVDKDALYIGGNMFNSSLSAFLGADGFVVQKSSLLSGGPIVVNAFRNLCTGAGAGPFAPRGVTNDDPSSTEGYFIGADNAAFSRLVVRRVTSPGSATPAISGNLNITVPTTNSLTSVPCSGSTSNLDGLDDRLFAAKMFHNRLTGTRTLWTSHNVRTNASGVASSPLTRTSSRWYELNNLTTTPALVQAGTVFDDAASNPDFHWMSSIAMNGQGHAALGCSRAGTNRRAEIAVNGRLSSYALGTMDFPSVIAQTSATNYNAGLQNGTYRWGDYSATSVDPADQMSIWTFQEYCNANNSWAVRVIKLLAPPPATPSSANPPQVAQGASGINVIVTGTSSAGSGFFDPDVTYPNHISAAVGGSGVTVNSVTFTDPTHVTLNVNVSGGATPGLRTITVTNPDMQAAVSASGILEVIAPCAVPGDVNTNGTVDAEDIQGFVDCLLNGSTPAGDCACANITLGAFLGLLL